MVQDTTEASKNNDSDGVNNILLTIMWDNKATDVFKIKMIDW